MSNTPTLEQPNLGRVITNPTARKVVYGVYAVGAFAIGGVAAFYLGIGQPLPEVVVGAQAVAAYAGIGIGALAAANTSA